MSLTLVYSQEAEGLHTTAFIPVFRDLYDHPDYHKTRQYINACVRSAGIEDYGIYDRDNGYTLALDGKNAIIRFMYFYEGDQRQESEIRFNPDNEEQAGNVVEWLAELTSELGVKDDT